MAGQVVRVKREILETCMTCPLCKKLLKEATTISLCLHTFCRKCIYEKLSDEEADSCPVCNIDLGCLPVEKLRPDHNLQDIRAKIFPLKRRKISAPEVSPLASLPVKRKERSLSSLVVNTPKVPMQSGSTGRRSKNVARKAASRGCSFGIEEPLKKEEDSGEDDTSSSSSSDYLNKSVRHRRQDSSLAEPSNSVRHEDLENDVGAVEGKADLWTPLNCLVEAANRTKSTKLNFQVPSLAKLEPSDGEFSAQETKEKVLSLGVPNYGLYMPKTRNKEHGSNPKAKDKHNGTTLLPESMKRKRLRATARNKAAASGELGSPAHVVLDASAAKCRRNNPIWFSLIASEDSYRKGGFSLPQISTSYLRIKDGKMPVSSIQKYLVKKLDLKSEAEVEILCRGQPVLPSQQLQNLVDLWFRTASTAKKIPASIGSSAKDFVMVLSYCRKVQTP
ncbi:E3 ubiquitin protein ligase DRIP2-like isoform X1 [Momordica charantia]|uniref:E3 ubiquitin protein ligase DRIP2-like isoform X1 n=1 Tax=Momordica charantia TaxID=3673 RepID=A0A6J1CPV5_MOMCH|nr:E3 ubiquitin protein ligase DRIP2-like isoform X1 [Momordica charantia]